MCPGPAAIGDSSLVERDHCAAWDLEDPLAQVRGRFHLPPGLLYFDGNSLGPPVKDLGRALSRVIDHQWGEDLVSAWNRHDWIDLPRRVGSRIAPLVGARADEVVVCDSVSVNLFKVLAAALSLRPGRPVIVCQADHFPTDLYIAQGLVSLLGEPARLRTAPLAELDAALDDTVAAVCLSHVDFRSGRLEDMAGLTRQIQASGALAVWDLSHSAGALPVDLGACGVDLAVGCGYKFLGGGPGAPSFLYVSRRHHVAASTPLWGWLGHRDPFAFEARYQPADGVDRFLCGTPPILSLAALDIALEAFSGVDLRAIRDKSIALGDLFLRLVEQECSGFAVGRACPALGADRGSQVTLRHTEGHAIVQALIARGLVGDFRAPDLVRFGISPLFHSFVDVFDAVKALRAVLEQEEYLQARFRHVRKVT